METVKLTCVECPVGCSIEVVVENGKAVSVKGNSCPRGKMYAESEVVCPMRVLTTTLRGDNGKQVPVKTDKPVQKSKLLDLVASVRGIVVKTPTKIGDIVVENLSDGANLVVSGNIL